MGSFRNHIRRDAYAAYVCELRAFIYIPNTFIHENLVSHRIANLRVSEHFRKKGTS